MQPLAKRSRALAMSTRPVSTGTPTASIDSTSALHQRQHDVEIVNHQVEDDVDVEAALGKRAEPVHFDEARIGEQRPRGLDRRVEALGVADGQQRRPLSPPAAIISSASASDRAIGFSTSTGMPAARNGSAMSRCSSVGTAIVTASTCPSELARIEQRPRAVRRGDLLGARAVGVDDRDQLDARQRRQDPRVMSAEMADADDGDAQACASTSATSHEDTKSGRRSCFMAS